jgi:cell cycle checkpoint control protein RAD9A
VYSLPGIVKTHRLPLLVPSSLLSPGVPESENESRLTIGPRAIKDITEHFSSGRGMKNDPQLVWTFGETDVVVKSLESSIDAKGALHACIHVSTVFRNQLAGRAQLATELTISADEFDVYEIYAPPITIAFHLREFNVCLSRYTCTAPCEPTHVSTIGYNCIRRIHGLSTRPPLY